MLNVYRQWIASDKSKLWCRENFIVAKTLFLASKIGDGIIQKLTEKGLIRPDDERLSEGDISLYLLF